MSLREFPGFFKVGEQRLVSGNKSVKRLKVSPEELREDPKIDLRHRNVLKFQNKRELGETAGVQAIKEFYRMKTSHKEKTSTTNFSLPFLYNSCEVDFIKGNGERFFGTWCVDNGRKKENYIMGEVIYNTYYEDYILQNLKPYKKVIDACSVPTDFITICKDSPSMYLLGDPVHFDKNYLPPWYCCCFVPRQNAVMVGGDEYLLFGNLNTINFRDYAVSFPGKVFTVSYHETAKARLVGLHTGEVCFMDPRKRPFMYSIKISNEAVNDSVFLNDHEVIVTDIQGKLVKVDLRVRKVSTMFYGHNHSATKRPFSVANEMLCATGADNVVRIWHTTAGGNPIHVQKPTSTHEVRGWLHADGNKTYLNYFERETRTVFTI